MPIALELGDLTEIHLHQGLTTKDVDENFKFEMIGVDFGNGAVEICEWTFFDANTFADVVFHLRCFALWRILAIALCRQESFNFFA